VVGTRVVIISENPAERHDLWLWLLSAGCVPVTGSDFKAGKRLLQADLPDLLVTDVRLGAFNGLHLAVHGRSRDAGMKAIVIGDPDSVLENDARAIGAHYLKRPLTQTLFLQSLIEVLNINRPGRRSPRKRIVPIHVLVDNVEGKIVDISYEGLRIELSAVEEHRLPRTFTIRLGDNDLGLAAQWIWSAQHMPDRFAVTYGVRLGWNDPGVTAQWRALVDATSGAVSVAM
jgi:DNA-binding response OmpR family regulator